ncbi:MAG TPA: MotA/TolQ/ExbB proton channel family protein [Phycisphaerales bacterium]|nr:MotA/TolQ/ExbB proton channel family protein [Phycisphaerales bacterium]HMP35998.1 MotA/TolQ/ExbB proton channel family protein [Phycisphaerales bacterium]
MSTFLAATPITDSFASAFFVSWSYQMDGARRLELLGSIIIWTLLGLSIVNVGLIGWLAMANGRRSIVPPGVVGEMRRLCDQQRYREALELAARDRSFFGRVLYAGLKEASVSATMGLRRTEEVAEELTVRLLRRVEYLNVLGQVAPMIGLFGTVYGMILAFRAVVIAGGNADPVLLAAGIGTALVTTFWGLVVAIPALSAYAMIRNRVDELTTEAQVQVERLVSPRRARGAAPQQEAAAGGAVHAAAASGAAGGSLAHPGIASPAGALAQGDPRRTDWNG